MTWRDGSYMARRGVGRSTAGQSVHIHSIRPRGQQPVGTSALISEFGGLVSNSATAMLNPPLPERVMKCQITEKGVKCNDRITLACEPFIGTLGVSPQIEAVSSLQPDYWGGNMVDPKYTLGASILKSYLGN